MFDFSLSEILLVVIIAVVFIGPNELPAVVRAIARGFRQLKGLSREIQDAFASLTEESGVNDAKREFTREVKMITGDDGKEYESYDISDLMEEHQHWPEKKAEKSDD